MNPPADVDAILDGWRLPRPRVTAEAERANGDEVVRHALDWVGERV